ncbi:FtsX-like permease family protein [Dictyobacter formicarum]|uniref:ABC3 transporter permease C-terminal domain-containing protein n=1 Tax=Dictyobacter formicarum TaxID=2778368 RepID=A0ABQ3VJ82_9CHLR|nr:FtsX-like permease family protein [Dictyobacter formicarum]GHO85673.1 hypothetical protein KSZ_36790 [Dictyobacter formicarum]
MAMYSHKLTRQPSAVMLPAIALLARKLLKQTWGLLLVTLCGLIACVGLVSAIPLFSQVEIQTGLQGVLKQTPGGAQITATFYSSHPTAAQQQSISNHIDHVMQMRLPGYVGTNAPFTLSTPRLQMLNTRTGKAAPDMYVSVYGFEASVMAQQVTVLKGRLPQMQPATDNEIEIALTEAVANKLGLQLGSRQQVRYPIAAGSAVWNLHVVGIVAIHHEAGNIWLSNYLTPSDQSNQGIDTSAGSNDVLGLFPTVLPRASSIKISPSNNVLGNVEPGPDAPVAVTSRQPIVATTQTLSYTASQTTRAPLSGGPGTGDLNPQFTWYYSYPLNISHIEAYNLAGVINTYEQLQNSFYGIAIPDAHVTSLSIYSAAMERLILYKSHIPIGQVVVTLLLISLLGLALYTVSLLANILVERQLTTIVMLRSRGATQRDIFGAFAMQGVILCLIALLAGPALAMVLVGMVAQSLASAEAPNAFATMFANLPMTIQQVWLAALITVAGALLVMMISLRRASHIGIVELRQQHSRTTQKPLWMRMGVDFFLLVVIVAGLGYYQLLASITARNLLAPLAFLGAAVIMLTVVLLFLRFFPALTRLGTRIITRSKGAPGVLAFAQMERQPHATLRMLLLLSLALSSSIYLLTFINTQQSRMVQVANYKVGADFSGNLPAIKASQDFADLKAQYANKPGVISTTLGNVDTMNLINSQVQVQIMAVDADTYAQTANWQSMYSDQPLKTLTDQLVAHRAEAMANNEVFVVVDDGMWNALNLSPGQTFTLKTADSQFQHIRFVALARVNYLPHIPVTQTQPFNYNMLVDYQAYSAVYAKNYGGAHLQPNYLWLKTRDDASSLSRVRQAFPDLQDRRVLIERVLTEPLQVAIRGTLMLGLVVALILLLIGVGLTAWLSVKQRRMSFAVLRALGMTPVQIARILLWEQGVIYLFSLLLGLLIGWVCLLTIIPAFSMIDGFMQTLSFAFDGPTLPLARYAPIPMNWIGLALLIFVVICGCVFLWTSRFGSRPAMSQALRLSED